MSNQLTLAQSVTAGSLSGLVSGFTLQVLFRTFHFQMYPTLSQQTKALRSTAHKVDWAQGVKFTGNFARYSQTKWHSWILEGYSGFFVASGKDFLWENYFAVLLSFENLKKGSRNRSFLHNHWSITSQNCWWTVSSRVHGSDYGHYTFTAPGRGQN